MAARAMWKGVIEVGNTKVPVKLYSAVQDKEIHFTLLERKKHAPVEQHMVKPDDDEVVPYDQIKRGFLSEGSYVMLAKEELSELQPKPSRDIAISRFVAQQKLGPEWFVRPYYLGPDGDEESYFALAQALEESEREGVAHWVMRNIEYTGVLRAVDGYLMLITLRHADEVVTLDKLPAPTGRAHNDKEAQMAEQLVLAFEDEFDPKQFKNQHRDRVLELVEAKAAGKRVPLKQVKEKKPEASLADALERSLKGLQKLNEGKSADAKTATKTKRTRKSTRKERAVA